MRDLHPASLPAAPLVVRLYRRNEALIASHHPLRETLVRQLGRTPGERRAFIAAVERERHAWLDHVAEVEHP